MFLPAVLTGQVYVAEMMHKENGARAPVAAVLWASVSEETDKRLSSNPWQRPRLRPDEWKVGDQLWIIDLAGYLSALASSLKHLAATQFKDSIVKMLMRDPKTGNARVVTLQVAGEIVRSSAGNVNMEQAPQPLRLLATSNAPLRHTGSAAQAPRHRVGKRPHCARVVIAPCRNIEPEGIERARLRLRPLNNRRHDAR
jgi:hemolysin-activating ACP:hemolysin acyltransferase